MEIMELNIIEQAILQKMKDINGITVIFEEDSLDSKLTFAVADDEGFKTAVLSNDEIQHLIDVLEDQLQKALGR